MLLAIAAWLVWQQAGFKAAKLPLTSFGVRMILNVAWSWIFFGMHQPGWAFTEIIVLWLAITTTMILFFKKSTFAGSMMVPYLTWGNFASVLKFMIW
ncbi:TspO/MBR family protein [Rubinisphaera italica]|uniref:TspO/MBR family protein n=1 Tax=Rubinisphaera italica TaxID=2527969 RepID=UPI0011B78005|nr:TspO/MBR family protein [Rubinisphaera italica]